MFSQVGDGPQAGSRDGNHFTAFPTSRSLSGCSRAAHGFFHIGGIFAAVAIDDFGFSGFSQNHEFVAGIAPDGAAVSFNHAIGQYEALVNAIVGLAHFLIRDLQSFLIHIERVQVFHDEFAAAHQSETGPYLITILVLDLIQQQGQIPVRVNIRIHQGGDNLFMGGPQTVSPLMAIPQAEHLISINIPAAGFLPQFSGLNDRHHHLLPTGPIHLLAHDFGDLFDNPVAQGEVGIHPGCGLANKSGS